MTDDDEELLLDDEYEPVRRTPATRKQKVLAGVMALLLLVTIAGSLRGGSGGDATTTTSTTPAAGAASSTSTTFDRQARVDAGIALTLALTPSPPGNVTGTESQDSPEAGLVDVVAVGWYDRSDTERFVFVATRRGPPEGLTDCFQLLVEYAPRGVGEINLGETCAEHAAFERGRMGGFLLPAGALWILQLVDVEGLAAESGALATRLYLEGGTTLVDTAAVPLDAEPVPADLAEALIPLVNFREAQSAG